MDRRRAVAIAIGNPKDEIFILDENHGKPEIGKPKGSSSIPMETKLPHESDDEALARLIAQEAAGLGERLTVCKEPIGVYRVAPNIWVRLYRGSYPDADLPRIEADVEGDDDPEVGNHRWVRVEDAMGLWLRQGALEMIEDYAAGRIGVIRRWCAPVNAEARTLART